MMSTWVAIIGLTSALFLAWLAIRLIRPIHWLIWAKPVFSGFVAQQVNGPIQTRLELLTVKACKPHTGDPVSDVEELVKKVVQRAAEVTTYSTLSQNGLSRKRVMICYRGDFKAPGDWHVMQVQPWSGDIDEWVTKGSEYYSIGALAVYKASEFLRRYMERNNRTLSLSRNVQLLRSIAPEVAETCEVHGSEFILIRKDAVPWQLLNEIDESDLSDEPEFSDVEFAVDASTYDLAWLKIQFTLKLSRWIKIRLIRLHTYAAHNDDFEIPVPTLNVDENNIVIDTELDILRFHN